MARFTTFAGLFLVLLLAATSTSAQQAQAQGNISAQLDVTVDASFITEFQTDLQAFITQVLQDPVQLCLACDTIAETNVTLQWDTSFSSDTLSYQTSKLDEEGQFVVQFAVNNYNASFTVSTATGAVNSSSEFEFGVSMDLQFTVTLDAQPNDNGFTLHVVDTSVVALNFEISANDNGFVQALVSSLSDLAQQTLQASLDAATTAVTDLSVVLKETVRGAVATLVSDYSQAKAELQATVEEVMAHKAEIIADIDAFLSGQGYSSFQGFIFISGVSLSADANVAFSFFIFDNANGDSGNDAMNTMESDFSGSGSGSMEWNGYAVKKFAVEEPGSVPVDGTSGSGSMTSSSGTSGDSSANTLHSFLF